MINNSFSILNLSLVMACIALIVIPLSVWGQTISCAENLYPCRNQCIPKDKVCLNVPIGNLSVVDDFGQYIQLWYSFVVGAVGIMATVIIMWGGFKWLTSRGNSAAISDAKDRIWSAIIGLILVFLSYNILYLLNRDLLKVGLPKLQPITIQETLPTNTTITHPAESAIFDLEALRNGCEEINFNTTSNLNCDVLDVNNTIFEAQIFGTNESGYWYDIHDNIILQDIQRIVNTVGTQQNINGQDVFTIPGTNMAFRQIDNTNWRVESTNIVGLILEQNTITGNTTAWPRDLWERNH